MLEGRIARLKRANKAASERKHRKRKRIQAGGDLSKAEADELVAENDVAVQLEGEMREGRSRTGAGKGHKRHCKRCKEAGHNSRTCKNNTINSNE